MADIAHIARRRTQRLGLTAGRQGRIGGAGGPPPAVPLRGRPRQSLLAAGPTWRPVAESRRAVSCISTSHCARSLGTRSGGEPAFCTSSKSRAWLSSAAHRRARRASWPRMRIKRNRTVAASKIKHSVLGSVSFHALACFCGWEAGRRGRQERAWVSELHALARSPCSARPLKGQIYLPFAAGGGVVTGAGRAQE